MQNKVLKYFDPFEIWRVIVLARGTLSCMATGFKKS